jgi:hypothetical protein
LADIKTWMKANIDGQQDLIRAQLHSEKIADGVDGWIGKNDFLDAANAGAIGPFSHKQSATFTRQQNGDSTEHDANENRRGRI